MKHQIRIKIADIILISAILISAAAIFVFSVFLKTSDYAEIVIIGNEKTQTVSLKENAEYKINSRNISLDITVKNGEIFVSHSDCRDGICRNTPPISKNGQSIVCAPAGLIIRVVAEGEGVDGITG